MLRIACYLFDVLQTLKNQKKKSQPLKKDWLILFNLAIKLYHLIGIVYDFIDFSYLRLMIIEPISPILDLPFESIEGRYK